MVHVIRLDQNTSYVTIGIELIYSKQAGIMHLGVYALFDLRVHVLIFWTINTIAFCAVQLLTFNNYNELNI